MPRSRAGVSLILCGLAAWAAAGCSGDYDNPTPRESAPTSAGSGGTSAPADEQDTPREAGSDEAARPPKSESPKAASKNPPPKATPPSSATQKSPTRSAPRPQATPIQLSAGVALPQSLPTGTAMGFSVDYRYVGGRPDPSTQYLWVIQPSKGQPVAQPVQLKLQDTLQGFVPQLRPEHGPFDTFIATQDGTRLSKSLRLK